MCSLGTLIPPPPRDYVTVCERNAELVAVKAEDSNLAASFTQHLNYPEVDVTQDFARSSLSKESARSAFLEHDETLRQRLLHAWYEHGVSGVLEQLSNVDEKESNLSWLTPVASKLLATVRWTSSLHGSLFPHLAMSNEDLVDEFSTNMHWKEGVVRFFAWHPHTVKYAVALHDDSIKVFTAGRNNIVPILKHKLQKGVSQLTWKPISASVLAVACQSCVLIWHVDPTSLATRPSTSCVQVLTSPGHSPVTSLCWDPTGASHLLTSSPADTAIMVWDVPMETHVALRRVGGGGVSLLAWSPDGSKVLAACPSPVFRVWETRQWTCEKWTKLLNRCQSACWSPDGRVLLFCTMDDPTIFSLTFATKPGEKVSVIGGSEVAVASADLSEVEYETKDGPIRVGGPIQSMVWDPKGERLAVSFKGRMNEVIALFQTRLEPVLQIMPCGFVRGEEGCTPDLMCFKPVFEDGAMLTVVWSGGRVSFLPLYFLPTSAVEEHRTVLPNVSGNLHSTSLYQSPS